MRQESIAAVASNPKAKALALEMGAAVESGRAHPWDYSFVIGVRVPWTYDQIVRFTRAVRDYGSAKQDFEST
jgi:hypothetical protein